MILKDLEKQKDKRLEGSDQFISSCKQLLENNHDEERELLRSLGLDTQLVEAEKNIELKVLNTRYEEEYKNKIFHVSEIEEMCLKYRFFLRHSSRYRGVIPPDLGPTIRRFVEDTKVAIGRSPQHNDFFIMAPPRMFKGYKHAGKKFAELHEATVESARELFAAKDPDPIFLYKIDSEHFAFLKKWGNDVTPSRTIPALFLRNNFTTKLCGLILFLFALSLPWLVGFNLPEGTFETPGKDNDTPWQIFRIIAYSVVTLAYTIYTFILMGQFMWTNHNNGNTADNWFNVNSWGR